LTSKMVEPDRTDLFETCFRPKEAPRLSITVRASARGLRSINLARASAADARCRPASESPVVRKAVRELEGYFLGRIRRFTVPIDWSGLGSDLDVRVWRALSRVPHGACVTYGDLAREVGRPLAARAVGGAVGRNPLPIVIPCHRVVGSGGRLTGFSCGLDFKVLLLELEGFALSASPREADRLVLA